MKYICYLSFMVQVRNCLEFSEVTVESEQKEITTAVIERGRTILCKEKMVDKECTILLSAVMAINCK